jgi:environmental stress-induced protein Ves
MNLVSAHIVRRSEQTSTTWSGGTTTQLAIYPPDSDYARRDFAWRLSSARVEVETSTFTSLPGFTRLLMILEGEMRLTHAGHHECLLRPFEQDRFEGSWVTTSSGRARDLNLMLGAGWEGELIAAEVRPESVFPPAVSPSRPDSTLALYSVSGGVVAEADSRTVRLEPGDLLLTRGAGVAFKLNEISPPGVARLIAARMWRH